MPNVLVMDADPDIRDCVDLIFREETEGFTILKAESGKDGIRLAKEYSPDLIILSLFLHASMEADEIILKIRGLHPDVKVIIMSAYELDKFWSWQQERATADRVRQNGYDAYIVKPFEPLQFMGVVREVLYGKPVP